MLSNDRQRQWEILWKRINSPQFKRVAPVFILQRTSITVNAGQCVILAGGVGAVLGLKSGDETGPGCEVHAGSGYWSQDSTGPVMTLPQPPAALWVRWPGAQTTEAKLPAHASESSLDPQGEVRLLK